MSLDISCNILEAVGSDNGASGDPIGECDRWDKGVRGSSGEGWVGGRGVPLAPEGNIL